MYKLIKLQEGNLQFLVLKSADGKTNAKICLNQGGRLDQLVFNSIEVIASEMSSKYKTNYASAILFPFANRIKYGTYTFNNSSYKLLCNEKDKNNAIHGLVFNKKFECIDSTLDSNFGSVTLRYDDDGKSSGFPFKFNIELTYTLSDNEINLVVNILNNDKKPFPFTLGWHPYFESKDLKNSYINFNSNIEFQVDEHQVPTNEIAFNESMPIQIKNKMFDTGYKLEDNQVEFLTPEYRLKMKSTSSENYLQVYTPKGFNSIAIEPMTGVADSFNNKKGLQSLKPSAKYKVVWTILFNELLLNNKK